MKKIEDNNTLVFIVDLTVSERAAACVCLWVCLIGNALRLEC